MGDPNRPLSRFECVALVAVLAAVVLVAVLGARANEAEARGPHAARSGTPPVCTGPAPRELCEAIRRHTKRPMWGNNAALAELVRRESSFDMCAVNPSRHICNYSLRGKSSHACGWFQLLPCRCFEGAVRQARCGVDYIVGRYGTPERALAFHNSHHWY